MSVAKFNQLHLNHNYTTKLYAISTRNFAKRGIYRGRRRKLRESKPGLPRGNKPGPDTSKTRTLTASPWGPPRYPIPRVQETSVEFIQNLNSFSEMVGAKLQCLGITVSSYNHASKAAMERMNNYAIEISECTPYLYLYQLIIVDDILGYSRDIGSRHTLWIPNDFTIKELIKYLQNECINDPKLYEIHRIDNYLNPFQPNTWKTVDNLSQFDGAINVSIETQRNKTPINKYREVEPIELLKIREKARNTIINEEEYIDTSDYFNYWNVPNKNVMNKPQGISDNVPDYIIKEKSRDNEIENISYLQQIDKVEEELNNKLLQRKQWYLDQIEIYKQKHKNDEDELNKIDSLLNDEFQSNSCIDFEVNRHTDDIGQKLNIVMPENEIEDEETEHENLCSLHFTSPKKKS